MLPSERTIWADVELNDDAVMLGQDCGDAQKVDEQVRYIEDIAQGACE